MADIDVQEFIEETEQVSSSTTYATAFTVVDTNWVANAKYLVIMTARGLVASNTVEGGWKLNRQDGGDIAESEVFGEIQRHYEWWGIYDAPSPTEDIYFQHKTTNTAQEVRSDSMALIKIRLDADLTENTDWRFAEDLTKDSTPEDTYVTYANIASYTPGTPADHRLILAYLRVDGNSGNRSHLWHLEENVNGAGFVEVGGESSIEGETTTEFRTYVIAWVDDSGTAGTREYRIQMKNEDTATNSRHAYSSIFVLELNAFADHDQDKNTTPLTGDDTTHVLNTIANYAPAATGNQVFITFSQGDAGVSNQSWGKGIESDDVSVDADYDDVNSVQSFDSTDKMGTFRSRLLSVASTGEKLEHTGFGMLSTGAWDDRMLAVFSVALAGAAPAVYPPHPRRHHRRARM